MGAQLTSSLEDYLETIYDLQKAQRVARVKEIADHLRVKMPSVTAALRTLQERGLVRHERYGYVELTDRGAKIGRQVRQRHSALLTFLHDVLEVNQTRAEAEACQLEHALNSETLDRLVCLTHFLEEHQATDDHWQEHLHERWAADSCVAAAPRAGQEECVTQQLSPAAALPGAPLSSFCPGFKGNIRRIVGHGAIRKRLVEMGITPNADIEIRRVAPLGDPIEVVVRGYHLSLRKSEAATIYVVPAFHE